MADDTLQAGSDTIATDHVSTLNGAGITPAVGTPKVQRVKVSYGDDGTSRDVSATFPLPVLLPDVAASGTITATDAVVGVHGGAGVLLTGTPTVASYVALALPGGEGAFIAQLTGTFGSGTVWFECSANSTTGLDGSWTTLSLRTIGTGGSTNNESSTVAGLFRGTSSGMAYLRVRITGATAPSVAVVLRASDASGPVALNAPLPTGSNTIGAVTGTFFQATQPVSGTFFQATQPVSLATNTPDVTDRAARLLGVISTGANTIGAVNIAASQTVAVTQATAGNLNATATLAAGANAIGHINEARAATLAVTVTAATGVAATLTLPAVASQFHYITGYRIRLYSTAARTGVAAPIVVTTTNLPGSLAHTFDTAGAIGTSFVQDGMSSTPMRSSVVNTATTIVAPIVTGGIWRITATYFTAV